MNWFQKRYWQNRMCKNCEHIGMIQRIDFKCSDINYIHNVPWCPMSGLIVPQRILMKCWAWEKRV